MVTSGIPAMKEASADFENRGAPAARSAVARPGRDRWHGAGPARAGRKEGHQITALVRSPQSLPDR